jgi:hypothetical protein
MAVKLYGSRNISVMRDVWLELKVEANFHPMSPEGKEKQAKSETIK